MVSATHQVGWLHLWPALLLPIIKAKFRKDPPHLPAWRQFAKYKQHLLSHCKNRCTPLHRVYMNLMHNQSCVKSKHKHNLPLWNAKSFLQMLFFCDSFFLALRITFGCFFFTLSHSKGSYFNKLVVHRVTTEGLYSCLQGPDIILFWPLESFPHHQTSDCFPLLSHCHRF